MKTSHPLLLSQVYADAPKLALIDHLLHFGKPPCHLSSIALQKENIQHKLIRRPVLGFSQKLENSVVSQSPACARSLLYIR